MRKALVLGLALVVGLGVVGLGQTLGGSWETEIVLDMTGGPWPNGVDITSELIIEYIVGDWTLGSETDIFNGDWIDQDFDFAGVLGALTISGAIDFDPQLVEFFYMTVQSELSIAGVTFGAKFTLLPDWILWPGGAWLTLWAGGVAGDVSIDVEVDLGCCSGCDFDFKSVTVDVVFPFCCAEVEAMLKVGWTGYFEFGFCVEGITIENLPWLTLGACVTFFAHDSAKLFSIEPEIDLGVIGCDFDLYFRLLPESDIYLDEPLYIDGIAFDGIEIACEIGGVQFTGITYFGRGIYMDGYAGWGYYLPSILYGYEDMDFFEAYQIATTDDGCCGPFSFDVTGFFEEDADTLFDFSYVVANMEIQVATQFTFGMGIETDLEAGTVNDLAFTFLVEW